MNYYKRHLGDYAKDTRWLSTYQHGVYALLLDWYYANEKPIPMDIAYRIVNARSGPERKATQEVLLAFFDLDKHAGFAHNKHADFAIAKFQSKSEVNSLIAKERESTKRARNVADVVGHSDGSGEPSHKPLATSHKEAKEAEASLSADAAAPCPHEAIVALYHEHLPANPRIKVWDGARADALRTRWREDAKRQSLDYWRRFFAHVAASPFLTGQRDGGNGRPFLPGLDWLVKAANFAKVIEGRYHDQAVGA
jgi:uncharacterized protein YdaU (DUF1376 family)